MLWYHLQKNYEFKIHKIHKIGRALTTTNEFKIEIFCLVLLKPITFSKNHSIRHFSSEISLSRDNTFHSHSLLLILSISFINNFSWHKVNKKRLSKIKDTVINKCFFIALFNSICSINYFIIAIVVSISIELS